MEHTETGNNFGKLTLEIFLAIRMYLSLRFLVIVVFYLLVDFVNLENQWVKLHGAGKTPMSKMSLNCSLQRSKLKFLVGNSKTQRVDHRVVSVMIDIWLDSCGVFGQELVR